MGEIVTDINLFSCLEVEMYTFRHQDILINSISKTTIILVKTLVFSEIIVKGIFLSNQFLAKLFYL